ncbi:acyltransferase family protein [Streptomyces sp. NPDC002886]|uniref:acyltransferase family protein n=1 Tax=Streptomyces sp. NPDC002886 TaxID=3364667 RepID=UPI0036BFA002
MTPGRHRRAASTHDPGGARRSHIAPLDGLRGLAVLGVFLFHTGVLPGGFLGVDLFFVLSGFLITGLLVREAAINEGRIDLAAFWGRRARRLAPALFACLAGTMVLTALLGTPAMKRFAHQDAPWVLANLANWHFITEQVGYFQATPTRVLTHMWSIAVEEQFYLLWPPLLLLLLRRRRSGSGSASGRALAITALLGALASAALMAWLVAPVDTTRVYEGTDTRAFSLLLGALAASPPVRRWAAGLPARTAGRLALIPGTLLAACWALACDGRLPLLFRGGLLLHSAAAAALILLLARAPRGPVGRILGWRPATALGGLSYGFYLWHWPLILLLENSGPPLNSGMQTLLFGGATLAAAVLSKKLLEDPVRYRAHWAHSRSGALALLTAVTALAVLWLALPHFLHDTTPAVDVTRLPPP